MLIAAMKSKTSPSSIKSLIEGKADVAERDKMGRNCVYFAYSVESLHLVSGGINIRDVYGRTPMHHFCMVGSLNCFELVNELLQFGSSPVALDKSKRTPLDLCTCPHTAKLLAPMQPSSILIKTFSIIAQCERMEILPIVFPFAPECGRKDALQVAAKANAARSVTWLISMGVPIVDGVFLQDLSLSVLRLLLHHVDSIPPRLLLHATSADHVREILSHPAASCIDLFALSPNGGTSVHRAILDYDDDRLSTLLGAGVAEGPTSLADSEAAEIIGSCNRFGTLDLLLESWRQWCATHAGAIMLSAGQHGSADVLHRLIAQGLVTSIAGEGALLAACQFTHVQCIKLLIQSRVSPNARDADGSTPLHVLARSCGLAIGQNAEPPNLLEATRTLIHLNANPNGRDARGDTPLIVAARESNVRMVEEMLTTPNVAINAVNNEGRTAKDIVLEQDGCDELIHLLR